MPDDTSPESRTISFFCDEVRQVRIRQDDLMDRFASLSDRVDERMDAFHGLIEEVSKLEVSHRCVKHEEFVAENAKLESSVKLYKSMTWFLFTAVVASALTFVGGKCSGASIARADTVQHASTKVQER